jgi:hypothetical protein
MIFQHRSRKGLALTFGAVLEGLFTIGALSLLYWLLLSRFLEIHLAVTEATVERHAINLANVLISSEKIAYEKDEKISRGVLDSSKLDDVFIRKSEFLAYAKGYLQPKDIGIGYPNTLNLVEVIDLENCKDSECDGWIVSLSGPILLEGLSVSKFATCLTENVKIEIGSLFRLIATGDPVMALWQHWDINKCIQNTMPGSVKSFFTASSISSKGLPILIRYPNGELHIGKIIVGVGEWV